MAGKAGVPDATALDLSIPLSLTTLPRSSPCRRDERSSSEHLLMPESVWLVRQVSLHPVDGEWEVAQVPESQGGKLGWDVSSRKLP